MGSKVKSFKRFKQNKEKITQVFKTYNLCKFKLKNDLYTNNEDLVKWTKFCKNIDFILESIDEKEKFFLLDIFTNKKQWYEFNFSKASYFRKMNKALGDFREYYESTATV